MDLFKELNEDGMTIIQEVRADKEANHQFLQTIVEQIEVGLLCYNEAGEVKLMNKALQRMLHKSFLLHLDGLEQVDVKLLEAIKASREGKRDLVKITVENRLLQLAVLTSELRLQDERLFLVSIKNIQNELEEQELIAWQKLIRILTHEIMNSVAPITSLSGTIVAMLADQEIPDATTVGDIRQSVEVIKRRGEGLLAFTETYRSLTRIPPPNFQEVSANTLMQQVARLYEPKAHEQGIEMHLHLHPADLILQADPHLLEQVVINLTKNALDALQGQEEAVIHLHVNRNKHGQGVLQVADNGHGIPADQLEQIFVPFYTTKPTGSGIGLSLSRQIMRMHKGTIEVQSVEGEAGNGFFKLSEWWIIFDQHYTDAGQIDPNVTTGIFNTSFYGEYGITDRWTGIVNANLFSRNYMNNLISNTTGELIQAGEAINTLGDIDVAVKYGLRPQGVRVPMAISLTLGIPTGQVSGGSQGNLQTGDGEFNQLLQYDIGTSFKLGQKTNSYLGAYVGFNNRSNGFSEEFRYGLEWGLGLAGSKLWLIGRLNTLSDKVYLTSKLSFEPGTGDAPDDWYVLYADPDSKLLQVAAYIVTAGKDKAEAEKDPHAIEYLNYQNTGGIPIATEWKFWGWQADQGLTDQLGVIKVLTHHNDAAAWATERLVGSRGYDMAVLHGVIQQASGNQSGRDSEGVSKRYSFQTAPGDASERLSVIAGSDSRNHRMARCDANRLVSKLRPHCVIFGGDMTDDDSDQEWREWFDDWQLTIGSDGRVFPIIPARGNHEANNATLVNCFDVPSPDVYYALTLGGNLFRIYTLNTQIPGGGEQRDWLGRDLQANQNVIWRMAQYHQAIRPHNAAKQEREELIVQWATLFHKYKVQLVMESDAHVAKTTWPIRPSKQPGSHEGFIRDDVAGTIYIGEGGWGAPLRANDDPKPWTRSHGRFNQFKWIFIDRDKIEIRTIKTEGSTRVAEVSPNNIFEPPYGLVIWNPKEGDVVRILNPNARPRPPHGAPPNGGPVVQNADGASSLSPDASGSVHIDYMLTEISQVQIILINSQMQEMARLEYKAQRPGPYKKSLDLSKAPPGRYDLIVKANDKLNQRFVIHIR
eukprot:g643.t1